MEEIVYPKQLEGDGIFFRMERNGKWENICLSDLTAAERYAVLDKFSEASIERTALFICEALLNNCDSRDKLMHAIEIACNGIRDVIDMES